MSFPSSCCLSGASSYCKIRMVLPTVTFVCSVIGIALALIYTSNYLAIPFALGIVASGYMCHQAREFTQLKTHDQNNTRQAQLLDIQGHQIQVLHNKIRELEQENQNYRALNATLHSQLGELQGQLEQFHKANAEFTTSNGDLRKSLEELRKENGDLGVTKATLEQQVLRAQAANAQLEKRAEEASQQLGRLSSLNGALEKMKGESSSEFKKFIEALQSHISRFTEENAKLKDEREGAEKARGETLQTAILLQSLLDKVRAWQDDATKGKLIEEIERYSKINASMHQKLGMAEGQLEVLAEQVASLQKIRDKIGSEIDRFREERLKLGEEVAHLQKMRETDKTNTVANGQIKQRPEGNLVGGREQLV